VLQSGGAIFHESLVEQKGGERRYISAAVRRSKMMGPPPRGQDQREGGGRVSITPAPLEGLDEKEAQGGQLLRHAAGVQFSYPEQIRWVFTDVFGAQPVRRTMEVAGEISDGT
jgi:hypothetical protein